MGVKKIDRKNTSDPRVISSDSYLYEHNDNIRKIPNLNAERNFEEEKLIVLRDKIKLKLLSTLGTREAKLWLPNGVKKGKFYCINRYYIAVSSHRILIPEYRKSINHSTANDFTPNYQYFNVGHIYIEGRDGMLRPSDRITGGCYYDLLYLYCQINTLPEEVAIEQLCELFSISKDIFTMPKLDGRTNWHQNLDFGCRLVKKDDSFDYRGLNSCCTGCIQCNINIEAVRKILYPRTFWQKSGEREPCFLSIPFNGLQPLFHIDILWGNKELPVLLTDSIEIAFAIQDIPYQGFICTSWYGGKEAIPHVKWKYLENRKEVRYLLTNHSGQSAQCVFETAMAVMETLEAKGITIDFEYLNLTNDPQFGHDWQTGFISREEFITEANRLLTHITVNTPEKKVIEKRSELSTIPDKNIPDMRYILYPAIPESSITLLYADTGVGKTWLALSMAFSAALGCQTFLKWKAEKPRNVLYIDSEMDETSFQRRLKIISQVYAGKNPREIELLKKNFRWKSVKSDMLNIADEKDQETIDRYIKEAGQENGRSVSLIILDNLSTLTAFADSAKSWSSLFLWLKKLKDKGCGVLILHHANKEGGQRGTSVKTATVDNVIRLEHEETVNVNSLAMSIHIEKGREVYGAAKRPVSIEINPQSRNPKWYCTTATMSREDKDKFIIDATRKKSHSIKEIAECLGVVESTVKARKKKLKDENPDIFKIQESPIEKKNIRKKKITT
jgi:KaiC/GvpD/RAD55 family RecA-like ATPase